MDYLRSRMEWKEASGEQQLGEFSGHAAVFGNRDLGGDIIEPGAFARTLKARDGKAVLLLGHDAGKRVGVVYLSEDGKGLRVDRGVLNLKTQQGRDAYEDVKFQHSHGIPLELSIGYETVKKEHRGDTRHLQEIKLHEVSLVTIAMNPKARVTAVKSDDDIEALKARVASLESDLATLRATTAPAPAPVADPTADPHMHSVIDVPESYRSALAELRAFVRDKE